MKVKEIENRLNHLDDVAKDALLYLIVSEVYNGVCLEVDDIERMVEKRERAMENRQAYQREAERIEALSFYESERGGL